MIYMSYNLKSKTELFSEVSQEQCADDPDLPGCDDLEAPSKITDLKVESGLNKLTLYWMVPEKGSKSIKEYVNFLIKKMKLN